MITRRTILKLGAAAALAPTLTTAQAKGLAMPRVFYYAPHPDDETLSMGLAMMHFIASGYEVHLVSITNGNAIGVANTLNGQTAAGTAINCSLGDHPYRHNPAREGYAPLTVADIGAARLKEARAALGAMAMLPSATPGTVVHHYGGLSDGFGGPAKGAATSTAVAQVKAIIKGFIDDYPNSLHYTMSASDAHPDHAACGLALRELKNELPALTNSKFFVSRLYWGLSQADGKYPQVVLDEADGTLQWYGSGSTSFANRKAEYDAWLRTKVIVPFKAWNPAAGAYGIGYHQVATQFNNNFAPGVSMANVWHS